MGVTVGFARLSSDSEILALKASGISMYQILPPVIIVATLIALLTSFVSIKLIPISNVAMKQLSYLLLKEKISKGINEQTFTEALGDVVVYVDKIDKISGEWHNVWVSDMRGVDNPVVTMASTGRMNSSLKNMMVSIILRNGSLHKPGIDSAQIIQFDQYQINIPLQIPETSATRLKRTSLTMNELTREAQHAKDNTKSKRSILVEYHKRLVLPVGCLIISIIGLPLGLQARPGKKALGIQAGLAIFVLYYIVFTFGKNLAENGTLPVWLAMWIPNSIFFVLAAFWIFRISNEKPLIPTVVTTFFQKVLHMTFTPFKVLYQPVLLWIRGVSNKTSFRETRDTLAKRKVIIRGNAKSREYHLPICEYYNCKNCTLEFKDIQVAREAGFKPCIVCKDLIDD